MKYLHTVTATGSYGDGNGVSITVPAGTQSHAGLWEPQALIATLSINTAAVGVRGVEVDYYDQADAMRVMYVPAVATVSNTCSTWYLSFINGTPEATVLRGDHMILAPLPNVPVGPGWRINVRDVEAISSGDMATVSLTVLVDDSII